MKVVVIGAGSIGSCAALRLARRGVSVTVVDAQQAGAGLSAHGFGWVNAFDTESDPYYELSIAALRAHRDLAALTGGEPWFHQTGNLHWADSAEGAAQLSATAERYRARAYSVEEFDAERAGRDLQSGLSVTGLHGPLFHYPADAHVISDRFVASVQDHARRSGVTFRTGDAVRDLLGDDQVRGVLLASGERIEADAVVLCAGRGTAELLGRVGAAVPVVEPGDPTATTMGLLVRTSPVNVRVDRILHAPHLSIRPHTGARLVLHCHDVDEELDPGADWAGQGRVAAQRVLARLADVLPETAAADVRVESAYVGVRPMPADRMSVVGWVPDVGALYMLLTHSGLTLAPVLGEIAAQEVAGEPSTLAVAFRPDRFATTCQGA